LLKLKTTFSPEGKFWICNSTLILNGCRNFQRLCSTLCFIFFSFSQSCTFLSQQFFNVVQSTLRYCSRNVLSDPECMQYFHWQKEDVLFNAFSPVLIITIIHI
jgi:tRNA(His) 5'-end guanylyltransferase